VGYYASGLGWICIALKDVLKCLILTLVGFNSNGKRLAGFENKVQVRGAVAVDEVSSHSEQKCDKKHLEARERRVWKTIYDRQRWAMVNDTDLLIVCVASTHEGTRDYCLLSKQHMYA
jgi:hypothetical protein